jgi:hypothetical protein
MTRYLKQLAVVFSVGMISLPALAQERPERPERAERRAAEGGGGAGLLSRLDDLEKRVLALLTDEQQKQARPLISQAREQVQSLQGELDKLDVQRREVMDKALDQVGKLREELLVLLTDEQRQQLREGLMGAAGAAVAGDGGAALQRLQESLRQMDLSDEQRQKIAAVREDLQGRLLKLRESAAGGDRRAQLAGIRDLMQEMRQQVDKVLTPEQQERLRGLMERRNRAE